ncbi:unnamed protein product [Tilletia controversa]|uniref:H-type lectin domain-containing protein n=2 Tax=Tilletia TaxID=13289 RepID=A0A8X7MTM6_9BASI|nr:hypothetical protein A4X06_0g3682 [Tilletia controversa]CAD6885700.1 unnamed protein product [Tilletia caries]CAD6899169.1 unnamed protein product [Tilletia controversa]CAD6931988.1 unnamed protein product [Tilletia controversa]CAD6936162.1 unnamed protein product [Tilletia controversa]
MVHPALAFAPTLQRALAVTQAEQQLTSAKALRAEVGQIFEGTAASTHPEDELRNDFVGLHTRAKNIEASHEEIIARRDTSICAVHKLITDSFEFSLNKTVRMMMHVLAWPEENLNSMRRLGIDTDSAIDIDVDVESDLNLRQRILRSVSRARGAYMELSDRSKLLRMTIDTWNRRHNAIADQIACLQLEVASVLAEVDSHLGSDITARNNNLLEIAQTNFSPGQDGGQPRNKVESWFKTSTNVAAHNAIAISTRITTRMAQLDQLISALKKTDEALSLRLAASATLNEEETAAVDAGKMKASLLLQSTQDIEKAMTEFSVECNVEDIVRHVFAVIACSAEFVGSNTIVERAQQEVPKYVTSRRGLQPIGTLRASKKLFQFQLDPPSSSSDHQFLSKPHYVTFVTYVLPSKEEPYEEKRWIFQTARPAYIPRPLSFFKKIDTDRCGPSDVMALCTDDDTALLSLVKLGTGAGIISFDISTLGLSAWDQRFQMGESYFGETSLWENKLCGWLDDWPGGERISTREVNFGRAFRSPPSVRLFMSYLSAEQDSRYNSLSTSSWAENVTTCGFTLCTKVWNGREKVALTVRWIAHDSQEATVRSGEIQHDSEDWVENIKGRIQFQPPFPGRAPSVLAIGITGFECDFGQNQIQEHNVSSDGFDFVAGCWSHSRMKHGRWSWVAIE